jgi:hypothetical protein
LQKKISSLSGSIFFAKTLQFSHPHAFLMPKLLIMPSFVCMVGVVRTCVTTLNTTINFFQKTFTAKLTNISGFILIYHLAKQSKIKHYQA